MTDNNMRVWSQVDKTDTQYTKKAEVNGQKITSLNGTAMIMEATKIFGPAGIGFGWKVLEERFDPGMEIFIGEGEKRASLGFTMNHTVRILFWFVLDGQRGELEGYGCTNAVYKSKYGMSTDGEAPKKSLTDAIKKCLRALGFSADVYLGMHDDNNYLEQLNEELAIERAEDKEAEIEKQKAERLEFLKSTIETMNGAASLNEIKKIHDHAVRRLTMRKDDAGVRRIAKELKDLSPKFEVEKAQ